MKNGQMGSGRTIPLKQVGTHTFKKILAIMTSPGNCGTWCIDRRSHKCSRNFLKQESIPGGCIPPAWKPYVLPVSVAITRCYWDGEGLGRTPNEQV